MDNSEEEERQGYMNYDDPNANTRGQPGNAR